MNKLGLALVLISLSFLAACGGGSSTTPGSGGPTPQGSFSNASLSGQYAYQLRGTDFTTFVDFREAGVLIADGNGHITGGEDDFEEVSLPLVHNTITGSYAIRNDGVGTAVLTLSGGGSITLAISLVNSGRGQITEFDTFATGAGSLLKQDTSVTSLVPSGTFTFRFHNIAGQFATTSSSSVGVVTIAGGIGSGSEDVLRSAVFSSPSLTAFFNTPDAMGRGTGTITDTSTSSFVYYVVDANTVRFLTSDPGVIGQGAADKQSGAPFSNATLTGNFTFGMRGDTNIFGTDGTGTAGRFTADGAGTITGGAYDSVQDGTPSTANASLTGTYSLASNGRGTLTLNPASGTIQQTVWMVGPGQAYTLTDDPSKVEDGGFNAQTASAFANSTLSGQFAFSTHGFNTTDTYDRVGTLVADGNGGLTLTYLLNRTGVLSLDSNNHAATVSFSGTYSVDSNGRATGSVSGVSSNFVFYLRSANDGDILQADSATEINGNFSKQQ